MAVNHVGEGEAARRSITQNRRKVNLRERWLCDLVADREAKQVSIWSSPIKVVLFPDAGEKLSEDVTLLRERRQVSGEMWRHTIRRKDFPFDAERAQPD